MNRAILELGQNRSPGQNNLVVARREEGWGGVRGIGEIGVEE